MTVPQKGMPGFVRRHAAEPTWVDVRDYGVSTPDSVALATDQTDHLQRAIDDWPNHRLPLALNGHVKVSSPMVIEGVGYSGFAMLGQGQSHQHNIAGGVRGETPRASITWAGATYVYPDAPEDCSIFVVRTPAGSDTSNKGISGVRLEGMTLFGDQKASCGVHVRSVRMGTFRLHFEHFLWYCVQATVQDDGMPEYEDTQRCVFDLFCMQDSTGDGGSLYFGAAGAAYANVSLNHVWVSAVGTPNTEVDQVVLQNTDHNILHFVSVATFEPGGGYVTSNPPLGYGLVFKGSNVSGTMSRKNMVHYVTCGPGSRAVKSEGTETSGVQYPAIQNRIAVFDYNQGAALPLVGTGSTLFYQTDNDDVGIVHGARSEGGYRAYALSAAPAADVEPDGDQNRQVGVIGVTPSAGGKSIGGIAHDGTIQYQTVRLTNETNSLSFDLLHENAGSSAGNRLQLPSAATVTVPPYGSVVLYHVAGTNRWRVD